MQGKAVYDWISGGLLIFLGSFAIWHALSLEVAFSADPIGPRPFPIAIGLILIVSGAVMALRPDRLEIEKGPLFRVGAVVVSALIYPFLLHPLGFVIATALMMIVLALALGGEPVKSVIASLLVSLAILLIIDVGLGLGLPRGPLGV